MKDINLLKDTEGFPEEKKKEKKTSPGFEWSKPKNDRKKKEIQPEQKGGFFSSLFKRPPRVKIINEEIVKPQAKDLKVKNLSDNKRTFTLPQDKSVSPAKKQEKRPFTSPAPTPKESSGWRSIFKKKKEEKIPAQEVKNKEERKPAKKRTEKKKFFSFKTKTSRPGEQILGLDVNLVPEEILVALEPKDKIIKLAMTFIFSLVVIGGVYGGLFYYQNQLGAKTEKLNEEIAKINQEIVTYSELQKNSLTLKGKIDTVTNLLSQHIHWTNFFSYLEKYTIDEVYFSSLSGGKDGSITLKAVGKDFQAVSRQYWVFKNAKDFVRGVSITTASVYSPSLTEEATEEKVISFDINLSVKPDIFFINP